MKVASGKSDNKKRKRDDLKEAISESPKKAKVHAQRKFAQGAAFNNSVITPIKDKFRPSAAAQSSGPMLTTNCPNTEDFLTFLCFRRTSILPPKLDFFKEAKKTENNLAPLSKLNIDKNCEYSLSKKQVIKKNITNDVKKKLPPATMQALRKKYQEQRLAKQKITNVTKLAQKVKGKNMVRTRSSVIVEDIKPISKTRMSNKENTTGLIGLRSGLKRIQPALIRPIKKVVKPKHLRMGLRSSSLSIKNVSKVVPVTTSAGVINNKKVDKDLKKSNVEISQIKNKNSKLRKAEGFSDFSSDDNEPLLAVKKAKLTPKKPPKPPVEPLQEKKEEIKSFVKTRSQVVEPEALKIARPTRKTKEAAALYVEMISKKLVSPEKSGDDDVSSVDSFPELPNAKKNEQRESEIKAKALANKKSATKIQEKEKEHESKKLSLKKSEAFKPTLNNLKEDGKNNKRTVQMTKKEGSMSDKQDSSSVPAKRSFRNNVKSKQCDDEEDEKEQTALSHRPSTRSRSQEKADHGVLKLPTRAIVNKDAKVVNSIENSKNEKPSVSNKNLKIKAKNNLSKTALKEDLVNKDEILKLSSVEKEEKPDSKIKENLINDGVKNYCEEKKVLGKEENTKKGKKVSLEKKAENEFTAKEKIEKKESKLESIFTKRPIRKCTAADKLCFEVDVFTSDEDDLSAFKTTSTRLSTKKFEINTDKEKCKKEEKEFKFAKGNKIAAKKIKSLKSCMKTIERKKKKDEKESSKEIIILKPKFENKQEKEESLINEEKTKKECDSQKKDEIVIGPKRIKDIVVENKESDRNTEIELSKTHSYNSKALSAKTEEDSKISQEINKKENLINSSAKIEELSFETSEIKKGLKLNEKETGNKKDESKTASLKTNKKDKKSAKNLLGSESFAENELTENENSNHRTRPIRQCSKGQKKWVETDSDSFSFYDTSDDDDRNNLAFELNFNKNKEKSSLVLKNAKNEKKLVVPSDQVLIKYKEEENLKKDVFKDHKKNETFSDSDEEPLKKKGEIVNSTLVKLTQETVKAVESNATKIQKDLPELHPLKKIPSETAVALNATFSKSPQFSLSTPQQVASQLPYTNASPHEAKPVFQKSKKSNISSICSPPRVAEEDQIFTCPSHLLVDRKSTPVSVPNRIEMILHSLKKDTLSDRTNPNSNKVKVTFENIAHPHHSSQVASNSCGYQVKPVIKIPPPREPISTHGLDLLSEVALPTTPNNKLNSQTERIEKWLKDSLAGEHKKSFLIEDENSEYETSNRDIAKKTDLEKSEADFHCGKLWPPVNLSSHSDVQKFGQAELTASQKLLKKNLFVTDVGKVEPQPAAVKKAVITSVQDLLKLQKEKKETTKLSPENSKHLKNCKCNSCVVKKGWFKNKSVPKLNEPKSSSTAAEEHDQTPKPFESLTRALKVDQAVNKVSMKKKNSKMSASVAPILVNSSPLKSKVSTSTSLSPSTFTSPGKGINEKKGIFQQRKMSFLERMKERERKESGLSKTSPNAFSPNNESSVYAFEPECEVTETASCTAMFKNRTSTTSKSDDECLKICEDESPATASFGTQVEKLRKDSDKTVHKLSQSASIAVQVNLDSESMVEVEATPEVQDGKSIEISTQTEVPEEDSDSPMFYIPLQQSTTPGGEGSAEQQLIQGVALKLGTEGPKGPNQRVVMKAKLVTKPPDVGSIKAVVMPQPKRIFDQKSSKPPIGTVQPTTRKPPEEPKNTDTAVESTPSSKESSYSTNIPSQTSAPTSPKSPATISKPAEPSTQTKSSVKNKDKLKEHSGAKDKTELKVSDECLPSSSAPISKTKRSSKQKATEATVHSLNSTWLPAAGSTSKLVEAPTFYATEKDFQDPFEFFEKIRPAAENFGLCRIVPPHSFKPDCKVSDDMRFTAYNQYVHRMFHRWGPNIKEMMAIKKYLATQCISLKQPPWIGGIEVDLPRLYQCVQNCGGLMKVMEKKKWHQVADMMRIPKAAQDRVTKLDDIYCKYLLPYDTLSHDERQKLFDEVEKDWKERQKLSSDSSDSPGEDDGDEENYIEECEECVVRGRNMALNQFYRIARNTMTMWFKNADPSPREVENEFWKHVSDRNHHVCVHSGSIDSSGWGYGFPIAKNNSFSKHPWNLKVLTNNSRSVLRSLGPAMGVTVPTLHVGMVFTAFCWYRDPHGLPWIEYLHTGAPKIWYGISDGNSNMFHEALKKLLPRYIKNKTIWLPSDTAMIPPGLLVDHGVSLCYTVQEPGQFILVFPRAFISSICTGYMVSESVYFAQLSWLTTAEQAFRDIQESCEPSMFSLEKLLFSIATDSRSSVEVLKQVLPMVWHVRQKEVDGRKTLFNLGLKTSEKMPLREGGNKKKKGRWMQNDEGDYECEVCRMNLFVSLVTNSDEEGTYCLPHAIELLTQKRHQLKFCKLMYTYSQEEMNDLVEKLEQRIESKSQKKPSNVKASTASK